MNNVNSATTAAAGMCNVRRSQYSSKKIDIHRYSYTYVLCTVLLHIG